MQFFAHTLPDQTDVGTWETLAEHEAQVAWRCREYLFRLDASLAPWGEILGRWHDIGKYSSAFQTYLRQVGGANADSHRSEISGKVDHSTAAAKWVMERQPNYGKLLAYIFAGHHAGLPDWDVGSGSAGLKQRLAKSIEPWMCAASQSLAAWDIPPPPRFGPVNANETIDSNELAAFRVQFWIRTLFSALVDADFLATESFMSPQQALHRPNGTATISDLANRIEAYVLQMQDVAQPSLVNDLRAEVGDACLEAANMPPGMYSLNVPTGGGKTLASMRFALAHAAANQLDGVVVAIPFTSIIEQNASVYRSIFSTLGDGVVLEHHSNVDPEAESETTRSRLQSENWDAPIVVTTNVQFFESLFASRTSRCRKIHRIARRVIILDEVQSLPVELLKPTLLAIRELVETLGCTVLLCTATQPAMIYRDEFPIGLHGIHSIIPDVSALHQRLNRTTVHRIGKLTDSELTARLDDEKQVLCIVNTRPHAAEIFTGLTLLDGTYHLSTRMCAAHRIEVLETQIRPRLKSGKRCRVVSTQLIEAGVDVDFPVVYRAICGLDSLTQAAGRCNREGRRDQGDVYFFESEQPPPVGMLRQAADTGRELLDQFDDLLSPDAVEAYFRLHYWKRKDTWDKHQVLDAVGRSPNSMQFQFREIAERYRFIVDGSVPVLVPWGDGESAVLALEDPYRPPSRSDWRKIQRYTVSVRAHELRRLIEVGAIAKHHECWVLTQMHLYDNKMGLNLQKADGVLPVDDLIC